MPRGVVGVHTITLLRLEKAFLSAIFRYASKRDLVEINPMRDYEFDLPKCQSREIRIVPIEQHFLRTESRAQSIKPRGNRGLYPWVVLLIETGMRPGEAAKIKLDWVDLDKGKIDVPQIGQKKRNARVVLLTPDMVELLREQMVWARENHSPYMFFSMSRNGEPCPFSYTSPFARLSRKVGISGGAHGLRHEYISRLFEETELSDSQVALLAGDTSTLSLNPYKHLRAEKLRAVQVEQARIVDGQRRAAARDYFLHGFIDFAHETGVEIPEGFDKIFKAPTG